MPHQRVPIQPTAVSRRGSGMWMPLVVIAVASLALCVYFFLHRTAPFRSEYSERLFIVPTGFSGEFSIINDPSVSGLLPVENGKLIVQLDSRGEKRVSPEAFAQIGDHYARETWQYADGTLLRYSVSADSSSPGHATMGSTAFESKGVYKIVNGKRVMVQQERLLGRINR